MEPMGPKIAPVDPATLLKLMSEPRSVELVRRVFNGENVLVSTPRQQGRSYWLERWQEAGMPRYTLPVWPEPPPCAIAEAAFGTKLEIAPASWHEDVYAKVSDMCRELDVPAVTPPAAPDTDRMWDMLVLAARTSRYGG